MQIDTLPEELTVRSATRADASALLRVAGASELANDGQVEIHETDIAQVFDLARDGAVVVTEGPDGTVVAVAWVVEMRAEVYVDPEWRGRGIGTALLGWTEDQARQNGAQRIRQTVTDTDVAAHRLLEAAGYDRAHTSWVLQIALGDRPPQVPTVAAVTIRPFDERLAQATFRVIEDAFREWRPNDPQTFEHWSSFVLRHRAFAPALSRIALDGDDLVGATMCYLYEGSEEGWIQQVATKATHRHRGIARALLRSSFAAFHDVGLRLAGLSTDSRTGALTLYERVGMHVRRSYTSWIKDL